MIASRLFTFVLHNCCVSRRALVNIVRVEDCDVHRFSQFYRFSRFCIVDVCVPSLLQVNTAKRISPEATPRPPVLSKILLQPQILLPQTTSKGRYLQDLNPKLSVLGVFARQTIHTLHADHFQLVPATQRIMRMHSLAT